MLSGVRCSPAAPRSINTKQHTQKKPGHYNLYRACRSGGENARRSENSQISYFTTEPREIEAALFLETREPSGWLGDDLLTILTIYVAAEAGLVEADAEGNDLVLDGDAT